MKCDSLYCPICRWGECVGDRKAARKFGWCEKIEDELIKDELIELEQEEEQKNK